LRLRFLTDCGASPNAADMCQISGAAQWTTQVVPSAEQKGWTAHSSPVVVSTAKQDCNFLRRVGWPKVQGEKGPTAMAHLDVIREIRRKLAIDGPLRVRAIDDFATVTLPERDCDAIRDLLITERPGTVIEIGLAYGSSALAIGEALISVGGDRHVILDPFQDSGYSDVGWEVIRSARLDGVATLLRERSQIALPRLAAEGMSADAAFVDGSHVFHNVFVDLYYLQMIVRPGGLVVLDDYWWPGVATAARYFETNLAWWPHAVANGTPGRLRALRLPDPPVEPGFKELAPFWSGA
jgi:predicted O-methyltransferase YrrM